MEENPQPLTSNFFFKKNVIFGDSIPRGIRLHEFRYWLHKGYAQLKSFPGSRSKKLLYYVEPTLKSKNFDAALLHVAVNDLLNDESQDSVQNLLDNLKQIGLKCKSAGVTRTLIPGIVVNNKLTSAYISSVNQCISNMCRHKSFVFIDNNNIPTSSLFRDGLHLLEIGKRILANNFTDNLNNFFTSKKDAPTSTLVSENPSETTDSRRANIQSEDKYCFDTFASAQFLLNGFLKPYRLDRFSNGGGILLYIKDNIPARLLSNSNKTENIFAEINFRKKKWLICASYNPHKNNISNHLHHLGKGLDNYIGNYDNVLLLGDFNAEFSEPCLNDFCDICYLKNLVKEPACFKNPDNPSCIDLFLTNRPKTFQCTTTIEAGISNFHKLVVTVLKTFYKKQRPKIIHYRNYRNFENDNFRQDLKKELLKFDITNAPLSKFNDTVLSVLDKRTENSNYKQIKTKK